MDARETSSNTESNHRKRYRLRLFMPHVAHLPTISFVLYSALVWIGCDDPLSPENNAPTWVPPILGHLPSDTSISTQCLTFDERGHLWFTSGRSEESELIRYSIDHIPHSDQGDVSVWSRWPINDYFVETKM